jgi:hypothetical protein
VEKSMLADMGWFPSDVTHRDGAASAPTKTQIAIPSLSRRPQREKASRGFALKLTGFSKVCTVCS